MYDGASATIKVPGLRRNPGVMVRTLFLAAVLVLAAVAILAFLVRRAEPRLVFFPTPGEFASPADAGLAFEAVTLSTSDGERLRAWWIPHEAPAAVVVYFHGNGGNLSVWLDILARVQRRGYSVFAVDYRGYGLSTGLPASRASTATSTPSSVTSPSCLGRRARRSSTGAARSVRRWRRTAATRVAPDGVILEAGFPGARAVARQSPILQMLSWFATSRFPTAEFMRQVRVPALVIHGTRDSVIPYALGQELHASLPPGTPFLAIEGGDHNDLEPATPDVVLADDLDLCAPPRMRQRWRSLSRLRLAHPQLSRPTADSRDRSRNGWRPSMRTRLNLTTRLLGAFGTLFACLAIAVAVSFWLSRTMTAEQREAADVATRVRYATTLKGYNTQMFAAERAIIVAYTANDVDAVQKWHADIKAIFATSHKDSQALTAMMAGDEDKKRVTSLEAGMKAWESGCFACHDTDSDMNDPVKMQQLSSKTLALVAANEKLANDIEAGQKAEFEDHVASARTQATRSMWLLVALSLLAAGVSFGVVAMVRAIGVGLTDATHRLGEGAAEVFEAAAQVASSAQTLSQSANQQAAALEETSASMAEMASMTTSNAQHSAEAAQWSADAEAAVKQANVALSSMVTSMGSIQDSSHKVSKILRTVDEIAFQTNILALNAAVEAARAGEAGMGFAVVADEVRSLAQRSAQAAKDTATLIEESLSATQSGKLRVSEMSDAITSVTEAIGKVRELADLVRDASAHQTQGFMQVTKALEDIEKATQSTAASAEESAAASETLNAEAEASLSHVTRLESIVDGRSTEHRAASRRTTTVEYAPDNVIPLRRAS